MTEAYNQRMARTLTKDEIAGLPVTERLQLIAELWNSIPPDQVPVPESHRKALDEALAEHQRDANAARPWSEIRDELFPKK